MKSNEELNALKEEIETVSKKLYELSTEELEQVSGGKNIQQVISDLVKQQLPPEQEDFSDKAKTFFEKMGEFYGNILPKK